MPTNVYFNHHVHSEANLYEDLVIESLKMYGIDVYYIPRKIANLDSIMNEDIGSTFGNAYMIEMYIEDTDGYGGEGTIMSKFGLEIRDTSNWIVSKRRWEQFIGNDGNTIVDLRPNEGDLIYIPFSGSFHEIKFVEHEKPFYQLGNIHTYQLQCETFEYSNENFRTGVEEIDGIEDRYKFKQRVTIVNMSTTPQFRKEEQVKQLVGYDIDNNPIYMTGTVADIYYKYPNSKVEMYLFINGLTRSDGKEGYFELTGDGSANWARKIIGLTSGAEWKITEVDDAMQLRNDPDADNINFETEGDDILDFTETNPFGEPGGFIVAAPSTSSITTDSTRLTADSTTLTTDIV